MTAGFDGGNTGAGLRWAAELPLAKGEDCWPTSFCTLFGDGFGAGGALLAGGLWGATLEGTGFLVIS